MVSIISYNENEETMRMQDYDPKADLSHFKQPTIDLLKIYPNDEQVVEIDYDEQERNKNLIDKTLSDFGIEIETIKATVGPTITLYEIVQKAGTKISRIQSLEKDIMMTLSALGIRIITPIPGKGTIGIEVPNKKREMVSIYSVINSNVFKESKMELPVALGKTSTNDVYVFDLARMRHLLIAGDMGQGKSSCLHTIVTSLLYKMHPSQLKFVFADYKIIELGIYESLGKHYLAQSLYNNLIITDSDDVITTLYSLEQEVKIRYKLLMDAHCRNIVEYNDKFVHRSLSPTKGHKYLPYIVIIIDEYGKFLKHASKEIEELTTSIASKAACVGMHLILTTDIREKEVANSEIMQYISGRITFHSDNPADSMRIIESPDATYLSEKGDLLISNNTIERVQCAFVDTIEIEHIVDFIANQQGYGQPMQLPEGKKQDSDYRGDNDNLTEDLDPLFEDAAQIITESRTGSTSLIQRNFSLGYNRAGRVMDQLEAHHIVGPAQGSKPREVLVDVIGLDQILNNLREKGMLK